MSAPTYKPAAQTIVRWLRDNGMPLGGLTGNDARALRAAVQLVELIGYAGPSAELLQAFASCVGEMQESQRFLAFHSVAHVLNWEDRARYWHAAGLPDLGPIPVCKFSPEARR